MWHMFESMGHSVMIEILCTVVIVPGRQASEPLHLIEVYIANPSLDVAQGQKVRALYDNRTHYSLETSLLTTTPHRRTQ